VPLAQASAVPLEQGMPVRRFTSRKGQRHLSGLWWSATTGGDVGLSPGWSAIRCCIWISIRPWWASRPSRSGCNGLMRRPRRSRASASPSRITRFPSDVLGMRRGGFLSG
jgi:hypothetical protein